MRSYLIIIFAELSGLNLQTEKRCNYFSKIIKEAGSYYIEVGAAVGAGSESRVSGSV